MPKISLDQWRALVAVVEAGGFAQAADTLNKTQSTISYAIRQIEERLGVAVFKAEGRKALLTDDGRVLYRRGKSLVDEAIRLERAANNLARGREQELHLAVESLFPTWLLLRCLERFGNANPETRIELHESVMGGTDELLQGGSVDLAICADNLPPGHTGDALLRYRAIVAAAPSHPLHQLNRPLGMEDLKGHRHLVIRDSGLQRVRPGVWNVTQRRLTVSHKATSIRAACMGMGFAWYPEDWIREELDSGQLKPLPLKEGAERWGAMYLVYPDPDGAGPGARQLGKIIQEEAAKTDRVASRVPSHDRSASIKGSSS
jgi:DNA-binding transcriptional LysR family regulator